MTDYSSENLAYVDKRLLRIDNSYQREPLASKAKKIASKWNDAAVGALTVSMRGSDMYVVDGGHRLAAAMLRPDVELLPCRVISGLDRKGEAELFISLNCERKPVPFADKFKALLKVGDDKALAVQELIEYSGRIISSKHAGRGVIKCIGTIYAEMRLRPDALVSAWPAICVVSDGYGMHERFVSALVYIENGLAETGESVSKGRWIARLKKVGYERCMRGINRACSAFYVAGPRVYAEGILSELNVGLQKKLSIHPADE